MHIFVLSSEVTDQIKALVELAEACPVNMIGLLERLQDPEQKKHHMAQMTRQTIEIPIGYLVTFSIEHGHPCGNCRHISISGRDGLPPVTVAWMIAKEFGFWGRIPEDCAGIWPEQLQGHGTAMNIVQQLQHEPKV